MRRKHRRARRSRAMQRRSGRYTRAAQVLAAAAAIAAGTQAYADHIRYDNPAGPGHFEWRGGTHASPTWLDLVQPAENQAAAAPGTTKVGQVAYPEYPGMWSWLTRFAPTLEMVVEDVGGVGRFMRETEHVPFEGFVPIGDELWGSTGYVYYYGYGSRLPEGMPAYLGVRFDPGYGDGLHYGWVGVVRESTGLDAFAWGYNTDPIPEPGTLALLALGAALVGARRRG